MSSPGANLSPASPSAGNLLFDSPDDALRAQHNVAGAYWVHDEELHGQMLEASGVKKAISWQGPPISAIVVTGETNATQVFLFLTELMSQRPLLLDKGDEGFLSLDLPQPIIDRHKTSLHDGADLVLTYMMRHPSTMSVYDLNKESASLAKIATADVTRENMRVPKFVGGRPHPSGRSLGFDEAVANYKVQIAGLADGGVDLLFVDLLDFDGGTEDFKACAMAAADYSKDTGKEPLPLMVFAGSVDNGTAPTGQSIAFFNILKESCRVGEMHNLAHQAIGHCVIGAVPQIVSLLAE